MAGIPWAIAWLALAASARAQVTCENYGLPINSSTCLCPPGFGGATCSAPACGGNIFQGTQRSLVSGASATSFGNVSASACACPDGWTGTGCNVCQAPTVCQSSFSRNTTSGVIPAQSGLNNTLTCNTAPRVFAAGEMSCAVINPTIQTLFPLSSTLTILRTLNTSLTPQPNATSFGASGSAYVQLWYDGVEQFYCAADRCTQSISDSKGATWTCSDLQCTCRPGAAFCGGGKLNLTGTIDSLNGELTIACDPLSASGTASCNFQQNLLQSVFGTTGLSLTGCNFGECVTQDVIDTSSTSSDASGNGNSLSGGVIGGLAAVGALIALALFGLFIGWWTRRKQRRLGAAYIGEGKGRHGGFAVEWSDVSHVVPQAGGSGSSLRLGGAGKTTLIEILATKNKTGDTSGSVRFPGDPSREARTPRVGFVPQQDVLPAMLTVSEALLFAARLRLPEYVTDAEKRQRVADVLEQLGLTHVRDSRIGGQTSHARGISGGEMRRVSIGLELVASPDVLILDEPTSGLDSVSAAKVTAVLHAVAHDADNPTAVIATIHQPNSQIYQTFDRIVLLAGGHALYEGPGGLAPAEYFASRGSPCTPGYNVADHLLDLAHAPPAQEPDSPILTKESGAIPDVTVNQHERGTALRKLAQPRNAAAFLTQLQVLAGREWKVLRRDKTFFLGHTVISALLGVFCGGLYWQTGNNIAGFQSRIGCLFFLCSLIAFSSLSALYNVLQTRPLFVRERSNAYYNPTAWLLVHFLFDVVPLRIIPTVVLATITYWMGGLAPHAANYFKFLLVLVLYTIAMTLFNFLLGAAVRNGGLALLLSALSGLYQMTFAGFFAHLNSIPQVLRWLQWMCPLKYALEALSVNEVDSGLEIQDVLQGVPVNVSASLIMNILFGFDEKNYYRDVLVLVAFIVGFAASVLTVVWIWVRETR
ncbi:ABC-2 type transporter-domain-containing protein [Lactarius pseudohatsudake]|nr:ABC-2 type transporter-domain-containing protein [Lactarius pseudohatsudake]